MAKRIEQGGQIVLILSDREASALRTVASEGAASLLSNPPVAMARIGGSTAQAAARRALGALGVQGFYDDN